MNLLAQYTDAIQRQHFRDDPAQRAVLEAMQTRLQQLTKHHQWRWRRANVQGLYLYGAVGSGKTYLMDLFYQALPATGKARYHFHQLMQLLDQQLRQRQGQEDPMDWIAQTWAKNIRVLCIDELWVQDVVQASCLVVLLQALMRRRVFVVFTSNIEPDALYANGVNRERFLPAIDLIHQHCELMHLPRVMDYRLIQDVHGVEAPDVYLMPINSHTEAQFLHLFMRHEPFAKQGGQIEIQKRMIPFVRCGERRIWFQFSVLCQLPRCQLDYLELAEKFQSFFVSDVPCFSADETTSVLLLIYLVDVLYDRGKQLVLLAAGGVEALYPTGPLLEKFERTKSRLIEMQSQLYNKPFSDMGG